MIIEKVNVAVKCQGKQLSRKPRLFARKKFPGYLIVLSFAIIGCNLYGDEGLKKGDGDMLYVVHDDNAGDPIQTGDFAALTIVEKTEEDSVVFSTYEQDNRNKLLYRDNPHFKGDMNTALGLLSEGDSAIVKINLDSLQKSGDQRQFNTKGKYLVYEIKVHKIIRRANLNDDDFNENLKAYRQAEWEEARLTEASRLNQYIVSKKLKPVKTPSGLQYIIKRKGAGIRAVAGDTILISYTGKFLSGKVFDTTSELAAKLAGIYIPERENPYGPVNIVVGPSGPYTGFEEAAITFPKGTEVSLLMPSKLAYGSNGGRGVEPYTPLLCDMEIVDVRK